MRRSRFGHGYFVFKIRVWSGWHVLKSPSFVVIITNLEEADGAEHVDPEEERVEVAVRDVDDLVLLGGLREAVPEHEDGERDGAEAREEEEEVVQAVERAGDLRLVAVGEETAGVEEGLDDVLQQEEAEGDAGEGHYVGAHDEGQVEGGVLHARPHVLALHLLEVELRVDVEPVGDLDDEEELEDERHVHVRVALPEERHGEKVFPQENISSPENGDQIKGQQLARLVELGVLDLAQVQLAVKLVEHVLLNDLMHYYGDQEVEEGGRNVLQARRVEHDVGGLAFGADLDGHGHVVVQSDEERRRRGSHLEHEPHHKHHGHARHDVRMILNHELVAQDGWILVGGAALHGHGEGNGVGLAASGRGAFVLDAGDDDDTLDTVVNVAASHGASVTATAAATTTASRRCRRGTCDQQDKHHLYKIVLKNSLCSNKFFKRINVFFSTQIV